ncbi:hypothetical protein KHP62_13120 [Rhodobacteraceae bacterium NNCM2]|nr:hypothetical protein [Coraliihabitans acroporae]
MPDLRISGASANDRSESDIRLNYFDPDRVIAASNDLNASTMPHYVSTDGGATWTTSSLPAQAGDLFQSDPEVDWASDGTAWSLALGVDGASNIRLYAYSSPDNGATWNFDATVSGAQLGADRQIIWVDHSATSPFKDQVYAIWHNGTPVFFSRRTPGPTGTWSAPIQLSGAETQTVGIGADVRTNANGDVFTFWPDADGSGNIVFAKSVDGGNTFTAPVVIANTFATTRRLAIPAASSRSLRVYISAGAYRTATKDLVYAVWSDLSGETGCTTGGGPGTNASSSCKTRVWFIRSTDGGNTWSTPVMINNQSGLNDQFHSRLCVDESNGLIVVTYHDTVADSDRVESHVYYQTSSDDGLSWSNPIQITSSPSDATGGAVDPQGFGYGDYDGLSGHHGTFFPCWTDFRNNVEEIWSSRLSLVPKQAYFVLDRSSFGQDEVNAMLVQSSPFVLSPALYVVVDGFTATELGITAADLSGAPGTVPAFSTSPVLNGIDIGAPTKLTAEIPSLPASTVQRFTWSYPITITDDSDFTASLVNVGLTASLGGATANAIFELRQEPNPYEIDGETHWLSTDLRVFQVKDGDPKFGATLGGKSLTAASTFITQVIDNLNTGATGGEDFDGLPTNTANEIALYQTDSSGTAVFNFAVARVRYRALVDDAETVRVFFRLFPALAVSLAFDQGTTYRRFSDGVLNGQAIPLLGMVNNNILSIPCFAAERVDTSSVSMTTQTDPANVRTILHDTTGAEVEAFFGCILDVNQPGQAVFPLNPSNDGPFGGALQSVLTLTRNAHQCLVAEIAFDPDVIQPGQSPSTSDKLAQRNLTQVESDNPGGVESRRVPNTFEVLPTPANHAAAGFHDELMIDWGNLPPGSVGRVYLPDTGVDEVLDLAKRLYRARDMVRIDGHTLQVPAEGISYIPVPAGAQINHAGLLTVDLPAGITKGQRFSAVVRQLTHKARARKTPNGAVDTAAGADASFAAVAVTRPVLATSAATTSRFAIWEEVTGTFQVSIPISSRELLFEGEIRLLSLLKFILGTIPNTDRWFLPFSRYVAEIGQRVRGFGGDPETVEPHPNGLPDGPVLGGGKPGTPESRRVFFKGKVTALLYDRWGDFEGFVLETERGNRRFLSHEHTIEDLANRAWTERILICVYVDRDDLHRPESIVFKYAPRPYWG